ncbi:hypothetical protein H8K32_19405 [Undibacterium jejuense]|uniref:Uncharacterized protein n=1 Tax=Undibacterium jejuense TaxID=1344949 RepID=A0A923HKS9_9BURK|nr:hypothetical protein [Undibacterium jejuense]
MNHNSTEAQVFMSATMAEATKSILKKIAQELLDNADSKGKHEYAAFLNKFGLTSFTQAN